MTDNQQDPCRKAFNIWHEKEFGWLPYDNTSHPQSEAYYRGFKAAWDVQGWQPIDTAKVGAFVTVWCKELPDRTDIKGVIAEYDDGEKFASSSDARGFKFTHWHENPKPPLGILQQHDEGKK